MFSSKKLFVVAGLVVVAVVSLGAPMASASWMTPTAIYDNSSMSGYPGSGGLGIPAAAAIDNNTGTYCKLPDDSATGPCTGYVIFDLGVKQEVGGFKFWPRIHDTAVTCPENVDFFYWSNEDLNHHAYGYSPEIAVDPNVIVMANRTLAAIHGSDPAETAFVSGEIFQARYVGMRINSSYDGEGAGSVGCLAEVQFDTSAIPEPSTVVLLATGLIGLLAYAWRKRK